MRTADQAAATRAEVSHGAGSVPDAAEPIVPWIEGFLGHDERQDVVRKLASSGVAHRHVFVSLPYFTVAPFEVVASLFDRQIQLPVADPIVADEFTDVWVASSFPGSRGVRWSRRSSWSWFATNDL